MADSGEGPDEELIEACWAWISKSTTADYDAKMLQRAAGRYRLRETLEVFLKDAWEAGDLTCDADAEELAEVFYERVRDYCRLEEQDDLAAARPQRVIASSGSLLRVAAYAEALPAVLRARQEVLGTREPLSRAEAVEWLVRETTGAEDRALIEVRYRFLVPKTSQALWTVQDKMPGPDLLRALDEAAVHTRMAPGAARPAKRPTEQSLLMLIETEEERFEIDLYRGDSTRMDRLLWWAGRLAGRCVGGAISEDTPEYPAALGDAVWLILAGIWPRVSVEAVLYPRRGWSLVSDERRPPPQTPYLLIRVEAVDAPLRLVSQAYQSLRKETNLSRAGHPIAPESEVLCMAALDAHEIDGVEGGERGFLETVLMRYRAKAKDHGVSPDAFASTADGHKKARDALASAAQTYGEMHPGHALLGGSAGAEQRKPCA